MRFGNPFGALRGGGNAAFGAAGGLAPHQVQPMQGMANGGGLFQQLMKRYQASQNPAQQAQPAPQNQMPGNVMAQMMPQMSQPEPQPAMGGYSGFVDPNRMAKMWGQQQGQSNDFDPNNPQRDWKF